MFIEVKKMAADVWELKRGREILCRGTVERLGYTKARLSELYKAGYRLFKNGKVVKACDL
jgi:hypothetical protein